jgi:hypothetical protein
MIVRSGINSFVPNMTEMGKLLVITTTTNYQPKVSMAMSKDASFIGKLIGYDMTGQFSNADTIDIDEAYITCKYVNADDARKLIYTDPGVKAEHQKDGNQPLYVLESVCYATSLTASEDSSKKILASVSTSTPTCSGASSGSDQAASNQGNKTAGDLLKTAADKATSPYGAGGGWCVNDKRQVVFNSKEPVAVGEKLWWAATETWRYKAPPESVNKLRAVPWTDSRIK